MNEIVTAIDIGTTKIVALAGEKDERGRVRILTKASVPTPSQKASPRRSKYRKSLDSHL